MIGSTLAHYEIREKIGAGGMGEVYRAHDPRLGRDVALKLIPADVADHPDRLARFEREAKALAALNHPNIVTIHSIEQADGRRFLTMELIEGDTLNALVPKAGVELRRGLDYAVCLADALSAAHDKGIVHRDLKPSNVMVTRDGRLKILDFGLAKPTAGEGDHDRTMALTEPVSAVGSIVGTAPYMSPEQIRGEEVDARADIFAFGILLYELLSGRRPFRGKSTADVTSAILRDAPPALQSVRHDVPRDLLRIVTRCLEKDRDRRFQTSKDVRNELDIVRDDVSSGAFSETSAAGGVAPAPATPPSPPGVPTGSAPPHTPTPTSPSTPTSLGSTPSVAVLPFANRSGNPDDEYFADGLWDELIAVLAKIRGLRVAARASSASFKGQTKSVQEMGTALGVETLLEGSVRKAGDRIRVSLQLLQVSDGYPSWSETYDHTLDDLFAVQDEIARAVVGELRTHLLGGPATSDRERAQADVARAARGRGDDPEAHRLYLQGKYLVNRQTEADTQRGVDLLLQAVEIAPEHALAWVSLAHAYGNQGGWDWGPKPPFTMYRMAREAAERALQLDPDLPAACVELARIQLFFDWDWDGATKNSERGLELAPNDPNVLTVGARAAQALGHLDRAIELLRKAVTIDPLNVRALTALAGVYRRTKHFEECLEISHRALDVAPDSIITNLLIASAHAELGRQDEAFEWIAKEKAEWSRLTGLAIIHHFFGNTTEASAALRRLETQYASTSAFQIAAIYGIRGDADAAFHWLERSYAQRDPGLSDILAEYSFESLHRDPRWYELLRRMGLPTPDPPTSSSGVPSAAVAVLFFENLSGNADDAYFCDGMTEDLITEVSKIGEITVFPRSSVATYRDSDWQSLDIARKLAATHVVEGSMRRAGERLRVTARLVEAGTGHAVWSERFDRNMEDVFDIQDDISRAVAKALRVTLTESDERDLKKAGTRNLSAYEYYLRGMSEFRQTGIIGSAEVADFSVEMFRKAIEVDPTYARAWAGIGNHRVIQAIWHGGGEACFREAREAAERALELDPDLATGHLALAMTYGREDREDLARRHFDRAVELQPHLWDAHYLRGRAMFSSGDLVEAEKSFRRGAKIDPVDAQCPKLLVMVLEAANRPEDVKIEAAKALERIEHRLSIEPDPFLLDAQAQMLMALGHRERALAFAEEALQRQDFADGYLYNLACLFAKGGRTERAKEVLLPLLRDGFGEIRYVERDPDLRAIIDDPEVRAALDARR